MEHARRRIPNRLRQKRKFYGYRLKEVAHYLGHTGTGRLIEWEQGRAMPSLINLLKLSILYHTIPFELYYDLYTELKQDLLPVIAQLEEQHKNP